jgi:hypothetical protein
MKRFLQTFLTAALATAGAGVESSFADEHEVNSVWWNVQSDYNGSNRTACVAENYNDQPIDAVFDLFPGAYDFEGNPALGRAVLTMRPYVEYKLYDWANGAVPNPNCTLRSYTVHMP